MSDQTKGARDGCFTETAWLDYARGLSGGEIAAEMRQHLDNGCTHCGSTVAFWTQAFAAARSEADYAPPPHVVASIKGAFTVSRRLPFLESMALAARLLFDTFLEPLPAGIRGVASPGGRHVVHEAGDVIVDFKIEEEGAAWLGLTGQVLFQDAASGDVAGTIVYLTRGQDHVIAQAVTNNVGELHMDFEYLPGLKLLFQLPSGELISVVLPEKGRNIAQ